MNANLREAGGVMAVEGGGPGEVREDNLRLVVRLQAILFLTTLTVFILSPVAQVSDSRYTALLSEALIHHGTAMLDTYSVPQPRNPGQGGVRAEANLYQLAYGRGGITYYFPHGSSILSIPLVAALNAGGISAATPANKLNLYGEVMVERVVASILMAILVCVFFHTATLMLPLGWSAIVALGAALGSQIWSTATRGLWSHTWETLLLGLVVDSILQSAHRGTRIHPVWLATILAWSYFVRPTGAVPIAAVTIYVFWNYRESIIEYAITGAIWFAAFVAYSSWVFGTMMPPYYFASRLEFQNFGTAILGGLISPSRGLFVYVPTTLFVIYLVARYWGRLKYRALAILAIVIIAIHVVATSGYYIWWGGYCYGPRLLTETIPWFVMLAVMGLDALRRASDAIVVRREIAAGIFLLAIAVALNARGACSISAMDWNDTVTAHHPEWIFDWRYPQFLAGLIEPPRD